MVWMHHKNQQYIHCHPTRPQTKENGTTASTEWTERSFKATQTLGMQLRNMEAAGLALLHSNPMITSGHGMDDNIDILS